jgi:drug/metabolite transporter (DMT)-like permease
MATPRHIAWFIALGLFWGVSPSLYKHLADVRVPVSHTIFLTGLGVGLAMWVMAAKRCGWAVPWRIIRYGAVCAFLMNIPFGLNLFLAGHVPPTELAIVITTSPFFAYLVALATGWESAAPRRLIAIAVGFASTLVLILSREGMLSGQTSWGLIASFSIPLLYCAYNNYAARAWPKGADTLQIGASESVWSGLFAVPFILFLQPIGAPQYAPLAAYWILIAAIVMWIVERVAYFTLIRDMGAVYTVQATYVATPAAVIIAAMFFGGGSDIWLWVSLALLMLALWLNNSGRGRTVPPAEDRPLQQKYAEPVAAVDRG